MNNFRDSFLLSTDNTYDIVLESIVDSNLSDLLDNGLFAGIPFLSTAISAYKIGKTIRETFHLKKIARFIYGIANHLDDRKREKYKTKILNDPVFESKEIEFLIILLDRFFEEEKASLLPKFNLAFLDDAISWSGFKSFAVSLDHIMNEDIELLKFSSLSCFENGGEKSGSIARLAAVGLIIEKIHETRFEVDQHTLYPSTFKMHEYILTHHGHIFLHCINSY